MKAIIKHAIITNRKLTKSNNIVPLEHQELINILQEYDNTILDQKKQEELDIELTISMHDNNEDFYIESSLLTHAYRIIHKDYIEDIWTEELEQLLSNTNEIPDNIAPYIDWDKWVQDCKTDGMGHHFSSYDGSEKATEDYYIFKNQERNEKVR